LEERIGYRVPRDSIKRNVLEYASRPVTLRISGVGDWTEFFQDLDESRIKWRLSISPFNQWVIQLDGPAVLLIGSEHSTFYLPERLLRQFGLEQKIPETGHTATVREKSPLLVRRAETSWSYCLTASGDFSNLGTSPKYKAWVRRHANHGRSPVATPSGRYRRD
jgi:hypothetical protein